jgi:hypothetical protein
VNRGGGVRGWGRHDGWITRVKTKRVTDKICHWWSGRGPRCHRNSKKRGRVVEEGIRRQQKDRQIRGELGLGENRGKNRTNAGQSGR